MANSRAFCRRYWEIDGWKPLISKTTNVFFFFSSILLNQLMTYDLSFHWFKLVYFLVCCSFFQGWISLIWQFCSLLGWQVFVFGLLMKFGLWSFRDIKHSSRPFTRILFSIILSFTMFFPSKSIYFPMFLFTFLYVVVIESFRNFLCSSFSRLRRFVVLSANVSVLLSLLISCITSFSFLCNLLCTFPNFIMFNWLKSSFLNPIN